MERKCYHRTDGTCFRYTVDPVLSVKLPFIVKGSKKKTSFGRASLVDIISAHSNGDFSLRTGEHQKGKHTQ